MKKLKILILVLLGIALLITLIFFLVGIFRPKGAGIVIETTPDSSVFIDGVQIGRTPHKETRKPGEVVIKLVPESFDKPLAPYETKVNLVSGVETVIDWEFGESTEAAGGEIVSFEKAGRDETSLSVVSIPDSAQVVIDGTIRAFAPYKTSNIAAGEHVLIVSAEGFLDRSIKVKTYTGYKLTALVKLVPSEEEPREEAIGEVEGEEEEEEKVWVEILSTPTGFLRVRDEPSTLAEEIGRVKPGEKYLFIEQDEKTGWFKIEYPPAQAGEEAEEGLSAPAGWVSNTYAEKIEPSDAEAMEGEEITPTPTTTSTPTPSPTSTPE